MKKAIKFDCLPVEIQEKMLEHQVNQGNPKNPKVFTFGGSEACGSNGGFSWSESPEGWGFWDCVLNDGRFDIFFEKYPKSPKFPRVMKVWDNGDPRKVKRVVFDKKEGVFIAWVNAESIEDAKKYTGTKTWNHAEEINEENEKKMEECNNLEKELDELHNKVKAIKETLSKLNL